MLMALFQNKNFLSSNKATIMCGQSDKNVQLPVRPRGLIDVRRKFNLLLHPIVICRLTINNVIRIIGSVINHCKQDTHDMKLWVHLSFYPTDCLK